MFLGMTTPDPVDTSHWRQLRRIMSEMDDAIADLYADRGIDIRTSHSMVLIRLHHRGPMTIRELAESVTGTHSAMSQKVAALRRSGHVRPVEGADRRTRPVELTDKGREIVGFLEAEWLATEAAVAELDQEIPYPLARAARDLRQALDATDFRHRIERHLDTGATSE